MNGPINMGNLGFLFTSPKMEFSNKPPYNYASGTHFVTNSLLQVSAFTAPVYRWPLGLAWRGEVGRGNSLLWMKSPGFCRMTSTYLLGWILIAPSARDKSIIRFQWFKALRKSEWIPLADSDDEVILFLFWVRYGTFLKKGRFVNGCEATSEQPWHVD